MFRFSPRLIEGVIIDRPNRFIANVKVGRRTLRCHVPCTGKIGGFRPDGLRCLVQLAPKDGGRVTDGTVKAISVKRADERQYGGDWVAIDQGEMNRYVEDAMAKGQFARMFGGLGAHAIARERTYGDSRFDFEVDRGKLLVEVKTPLTELYRPLPRALAEQVAELNATTVTDRLVKHVTELGKLADEGHRVVMLTAFGYDADEFHPVPDKTKTYERTSKAVYDAIDKGLETWQANFRISPTGVRLRKLWRIEGL